MDPWADLGSDLLELIAERMTDHKDFLHFGGVCTQWRSIMLGNLQRLPKKLPLSTCLFPRPPLPLLMQCTFEKDVGILEFISVPNQMIYKGFTATEISNKWVCGSFNGWLVTVEVDGRQIHLLNPLTRAQIPLPSLSSFQHPKGSFRDEYDDFGFVQKVVAFPQSSRRNELGEGCIVASIISCVEVLSICRLGDDKWTNIQGSPILLCDIIPYKGQIYAVNRMGSVVACDVANDRTVKLIAGPPPGYGVFCDKRYLVESTDGELFQVVKIMDEIQEGKEESKTWFFTVYKLVALEKPHIKTKVGYSYVTIDWKYVRQVIKRYAWVELEGLGDQMLFLGYNCSMSLSASLYPACKGSCIYFTDDDEPGTHRSVARDKREGFEVNYGSRKYGVGMYDMEADRVFPYGETNNEHFPVAPIWVVPNPWRSTR